jgi:hypothetical protein
MILLSTIRYMQPLVADGRSDRTSGRSRAKAHTDNIPARILLRIMRHSYALSHLLLPLEKTQSPRAF